MEAQLEKMEQGTWGKEAEEASAEASLKGWQGGKVTRQRNVVCRDVKPANIKKTFEAVTGEKQQFCESAEALTEFLKVE